MVLYVRLLLGSKKKKTIKKKYIIPIMHDTKIQHAPLLVDVISETVEWGESKKRGKNSTTEDIFEDEEETSFWH